MAVFISLQFPEIFPHTTVLKLRVQLPSVGTSVQVTVVLVVLVGHLPQFDDSML